MSMVYNTILFRKVSTWCNDYDFVLCHVPQYTYHDCVCNCGAPTISNIMQVRCFEI